MGKKHAALEDLRNSAVAARNRNRELQQRLEALRSSAADFG